MLVAPEQAITRAVFATFAENRHYERYVVASELKIFHLQFVRHNQQRIILLRIR